MCTESPNNIVRIQLCLHFNSVVCLLPPLRIQPQNSEVGMRKQSQVNSKCRQIISIIYYCSLKSGTHPSSLQFGWILYTLPSSYHYLFPVSKCTAHYLLTHICRIWKNGRDEEAICKEEIETQMQRANVSANTKRVWGSGMNREIGIDIYTLLYIKQITSENLLQGIGNATQCSVVTQQGRKSKKERIYVQI